MANISQLIENIPVNPIRFLTPLVEKREKQGINFFKINIGQPDLKTNHLITEELKRLVENKEFECIKYTNAQGTLETRKAWAEGYYQEKFSPEEVVLTNGGSEAMRACYQTLLNPNQANLTFSPVYSNYIAYARSTNRKIYSLPRKFANGYHLPPKEKIENFIKNHQDIQVITIISPDNPTGTVFTKQEIDNLFQLAEKYDLWVLIDEAYRDIRFNKQTVAVSDVVSKNEQWMKRAIFIATVSKEFSACGLRSGALLCENKQVIEAVVKLIRARLSINEITQKIIRKVLYSPRSQRKEIAQIYQARRDVVVNKLRDLGMNIHSPAGSLYCLPDLGEVGIENTFDFAKWLVEDFHVRENGEKYSVVVTPGAGFFTEEDPDRKNSLIRIAYVLKEEKLAQAMDILAQGIETYNSKS